MSESNSSRGMSAMEFLLIIFVVLKIVGIEPVASWSWWWVFAPLWISLIAAAAILVIYFVAVMFIRK